MSRDLTPAEVAETLHLHVDTVTKFARKRKLRGYYAGRHWRFELAAIEEFRRKNEPVEIEKSPTTQILKRAPVRQHLSLPGARGPFYRKRHPSEFGGHHA